MRAAGSYRVSLVVVIVGIIGMIGGDVPPVVGETQSVKGLTSARNNRMAPDPAPQPAASPVLKGKGATEKEWCQTQPKWEAKGFGGVAGPGCGLGVCDVPALRDSWIPNGFTQVLELSIHFNVFAESNGTNPAATQAGVDAQVAQLNSDFAPSKISFCHTTDFINNSTYRSYADAEETGMKNTYANSPSTQLNVYVVNIEGGYIGVGTFPWDPDSLTNMGGIVIDDDFFGAAQSTLTHEVGHCVGLWHTHHGVSEVPACSTCYERADGLNGDTTGDFASDTAPTPTNFNCSPPGGTDTCSTTAWGPTDPQNYMGYAPDFCYTEYSPHQFGRMHCWSNEVLLSWSCLGGLPKFSQLPDDDGEDLASNLDWSDAVPNPNVVYADDFVSDGRPIRSVRWWGSDLAPAPSASTSAAGMPTARENAAPALRPAKTPPPAPSNKDSIEPVMNQQAQVDPAVAVVGGDTCATAGVIAALPFSDTGNTCAFADNYNEICPFALLGAPDVTYVFTPPTNMFVDISLCANSAYDTKLYVYQGSCPGTDVACNDDTCSTPSFPQAYVSSLSGVSLTGGLTYYVIVDGYSDIDCGNYTLNIAAIICGDGSIGGGEECDPPNGTTCNASCQNIVCGDGVLEGIEQCEPPNGYDCNSTCQSVSVFPVDGWLISFHEPLALGGSAETPLGLYFCDRSVIAISGTPLGSCDAHPVNEYRVSLADCCLIHVYPDGRNGLIPALDDGFHEVACFAYDIDIQAVVGAKWVDSGGTCIEVPTANSASTPFWGWHSTFEENGVRAALKTSVSMSGPDWLYGPWTPATHACSAPNMAFQLITDEPTGPGGGDCDDNGILDACETGTDCQPNGVFDDCDIALGTSDDCQPNSIPDECDIVSGATDCQPDGVPDSCQLAGNDLNGNGIPDECDPAPPQISCLPDKNRSLGLILAGSGGATGPVYQVDDGSAEDSIGVGDGAGGGTTFGWANRFRNTTGAPIILAEIDVAFGNPLGGAGVSPGDAVDAVIWIDAAATGTLLNAVKKHQWSLPGGVHAGDGSFATHSVPCGGITIPNGADFYVGCGDIQTSIDSQARFPAAIDQGVSAERSWAFFHSTMNVFNPDNFAGQNVGTIDSFGLPGNWLIRVRTAGAPSATALAAATALRVSLIELQNPVPANLPANPPPQYGCWEAGAACGTVIPAAPPVAACVGTSEAVPPNAQSQGGCARWVGKPASFLEAQDVPSGATTRVARLQCTPYYQDWTTEGVFFLTGAEIVPSSKYDVQAYAAICAGMEGSCLDVSPPLRLTTARSGDVEAPFNPPSTSTQPDVTDVAQVVNKFKNLPGALLKPVAQLQPNLPELNADINALDVVAVVDAVKQKAYAFIGPCPCPSTATCGSLACTTTAPCVTAYGMGATCVKTCTGPGPLAGDSCINNTHCVGSGTCGAGFCRDACGRCTPP